MEFKELQARLNDPDPWVRVEALRILAMVEETRAMPDIERVFKTDTEPGVRQVAQWAGRIVYQAVKRASVTDQAAPLPEQDSMVALHEAALIHSLLDNNRDIAEMTQLQLMQYELTRGGRSARASTGTYSAPGVQEQKPEEKKVPVSNLLDEGLSPDLLEYFLKE